jgi:hypothetical protein
MLLPGPSKTPGQVAPNYPSPVDQARATVEKNQGPNAFSGWAVMVLHDLGAPTSSANIYFLEWWQTYEHSAAKNNPLNITGPAGTSTLSGNSSGVQNYATPKQGAQYTANNIKAYPTIYNMLKSNNVAGTLLSSTDILHGKLSPHQHLITDLQKWGSDNFAKALGGGSVIDSAVTGGQSVWNDLTGWTQVFGWIQGNWERIFYVIGGVALVLIALIFIAKSQTGNALKLTEGMS